MEGRLLFVSLALALFAAQLANLALEFLSRP